MARMRNHEVIDLSAIHGGLNAAHAFIWPLAAEHKSGLIEAIGARRGTSSGITRTNVGGGWHSDVDLPTWQHPSIAALIQWIAACADQVVATTNDVENNWRSRPWTAQAWANVNPPGGAANALHEHIQMNWHWSGCYYVQCDDNAAPGAAASGDRGRLVFENRWHGLRLKRREPDASQRYFHTPREGEVVFFPAWQHHRVEPHHQKSDRISIAFNLYADELERSRYWTFRPGPLQRRFPALHNFMNDLRGGKAHNADGRPPGYVIG